MKHRPLGNTGLEVPAVALGGIVVAGMSRAEADGIVGEAMDAGVDYIDAAPSYGDCEEVLGPVIEGRRDSITLACKTGERDREGSRKELEQSLTRLRTDHFDLYQAHGVAKMEDVEAFFAAGGAVETFVEAKEEGKVRFLGFSAHSEEAALGMMDRFDFDTILFPTNWTCWLSTGFGEKALAKAKEKGMGLLALKALARERWPEGDPLREEYPKCWYRPETREDVAALALKFTWSRGSSLAVPPGQPKAWRMAVKLASEHAYEPLSDEELARLKELAKDLKPIFPN